MPRLKVARPRRPARKRQDARFWTWPPTPQALRAAWIAGGVVLAAAPALYMWRVGTPLFITSAITGVQNGLVAATSAAGLTVQEIFVEGRDETPAAQVLAALGVKRGAPILGFDPARAKEELERLPWVREASVERRLPDTIHVRIAERRPLALWQRNGQLALIDRDGVEIRGIDPARFAHLPVLVGEDAPAHAAQLLALLATEPDLEKRVTAAVRVSGRRWNLRLDTGTGTSVDVQLPESNFGAAWARLAELDRTNNLLDRSVAAIDMRLPDRLVVRLVQETPPSSRRTGRNGRST